MVTNFDSKQLEPITVSLRADGSYHIIDGQHRTKTCQLKGITTIPARVIKGLTPEEESDLFILLDKNKTKLSSLDKFLVFVKSGDTFHKSISDIIKKHGYLVETNGRKRTVKRRITAIGTVEKIANKYGLSTLDNTLCTISKSWSDNPHAIQFQFLEATAKFIKKSNGHRNYDPQRVVTRLSTINPVSAISQAKGNPSCSPVDSIVGSFVGAYNYRLPVSSRISII